MKNRVLFSFLLIVISTSCFRCTPERLDDIGTAKEIMPRGPWSIDYYFAGQDKTAQYSSYQFQFQPDGTVKVSDGSGTVDGTWNIARDSRRNEVLLINIQQLQELNEQWTVTGTDTYRVVMQGAGSELRLRKL